MGLVRHRSMQWPPLSISTAQVPAPPFPPPGFDENSMVTGDLTSPEWVNLDITAGMNPSIAGFVDPTDGDCALVNDALNAPGEGDLAFRFMVPQGCTDLTLEVNAKAPFLGGPGADAAIVFFHDGTTQISPSTPIVLGPSLSLTLQNIIGRTPGEILYLYMKWNPGGASQTRGVVKQVRMIPNDATGPIFGGTFYRRRFTSDTSKLNATPGDWATTPQLNMCSNGARLVILTDAAGCAVEAGPNQIFDVNYSAVCREFNGVPVSPVSFPGPGITIEDFALPGGNTTLALVAAPQYTPDGGATIDATWPRTLYIASATVLETVVESTVPPLIYVLGDGIASGYNASGCMNYWELLRTNETCRPILGSYRPLALADVCFDAPSIAAFVASLAGLTFDRLYVEIGFVDFDDTRWPSVAAFQSALDDTVVAINAAYPGMTIYLQTLLSTGEGPNGNLETAQDYRDAQTAVSVGKPYVTLIDGTSLCTAGDLPGGIYPDDAASVIIAANLGPLLV